MTDHLRWDPASLVDLSNKLGSARDDGREALPFRPHSTTGLGGAAILATLDAGADAARGRWWSITGECRFLAASTSPHFRAQRCRVTVTGGLRTFVAWLGSTPHTTPPPVTPHPPSGRSPFAPLTTTPPHRAGPRLPGYPATRSPGEPGTLGAGGRARSAGRAERGVGLVSLGV